MKLNSNLYNYLPNWFREILDYQEICNTESERFEALADEINAVADNYFFQSMNAGAVSMWENIFNIIPNPSVETLEFRRFRVLNRISTKPPFTLGFLYQKLDELIGKGKWSVTVDYPNYTLYIESSSENQQYFTEVLYTINKIKPAHIVFINKPLTISSLTLDESVELTELTWNYRLGSWGLGLHPFVTSETKEVVVVPAADSIQTALLNSTASCVINTVLSARVNGNIVITALTKETQGNTAVIQYTVTEAQAASVTLLELIDSSGNVLTISPVYVPISGQAVFTHKIPVKEAEE
ncbi:MAG: putative phage tail protein [Candidatus Metalachnospira sp.]|nr:putative phage tail protein [Candidatus Metalachnospira sp.]